MSSMSIDIKWFPAIFQPEKTHPPPYSFIYKFDLIVQNIGGYAGLAVLGVAAKNRKFDIKTSVIAACVGGAFGLCSSLGCLYFKS